MPIYEYKAKGTTHCDLCKNRFEARQSMNDKPIAQCPECGAEVRRLFSRSFLSVMEPLSLKETFATHTEETADSMGLSEGFAADQIWD